jgi:hypothetical protein
MNPSDQIQSIPDQHMLLIDVTLSVEVDCWRAMSQAGSQLSGTGNLRAMAAITGTLSCAFGGVYPLGQNGLNKPFGPTVGEGKHFGPAAGLTFVTPNEMLRGQINHALSLNSSCANGKNIFPADTTGVTDSACYGGGSGPPHYGDAFQLNWPPAKIAASSHSTECKAILTAMATYGAFIADTGDYGQTIDVVSEQAYTSDPSEMGQDPYPQLLADLRAAGDADSSGNWNDCFQGLSANDFNLVELTPPAASS